MTDPLVTEASTNNSTTEVPFTVHVFPCNAIIDACRYIIKLNLFASDASELFIRVIKMLNVI